MFLNSNLKELKWEEEPGFFVSEGIKHNLAKISANFSKKSDNTNVEISVTKNNNNEEKICQLRKEAFHTFYFIIFILHKYW